MALGQQMRPCDDNAHPPPNTGAFEARHRKEMQTFTHLGLMHFIPTYSLLEHTCVARVSEVQILTMGRQMLRVIRTSALHCADSVLGSCLFVVCT